MKRFLLLASLLFMSVPFALGQTVTVSKMALMTFTGTMEVKAAPAHVWAALTDGPKAQSWYPGWAGATGVKSLAMLGASIGFKDEWGNPGKSIVLYALKDKELRLAHMPDDGSYVCQVKFKLEPKGAGTMVTATEQYSDNLDVPLDRDTAATAKASMMKYLTALKTAAEKK
jgi:uncharacterized protein YndB with AHSA1/START domain